MKVPVITNLESNYMDSFLEAVNLRGDILQQKKLDEAKAYIFSSPSKHFILKRNPNEEEYISRKDDIVEMNLHIPDIQEYKWKTSIIVPKNSIILGILVPSRRAKGLVKILLYSALKNFFDKERIKIEGNDVYIDDKKVCGIQETIVNNVLVAEAMINIDYEEYAPFFKKHLSKKEFQDIAGLRDLNKDFNVSEFIDFLTADFRQFLYLF